MKGVDRNENQSPWEAADTWGMGCGLSPLLSEDGGGLLICTQNRPRLQRGCSCVGCGWTFLGMTQRTDSVGESLWGVQSGASTPRVIKLAKTQWGAPQLLHSVGSQPPGHQ